MSKEPQTYIHGTKLARKLARAPELQVAHELYIQWRDQSLSITGRSEAEIDQLCELLNNYKNAVEPIFDARSNSAQEVLQPSILEEFFEILFCRVEDELGTDLLRRPASGFIGLVFNPKSLTSLLTTPEYTIRAKDHDFVLGACIRLSIKAEGTTAHRDEVVVVPAVALECKRYLERNMLDECAGTAEKIKKTTPYCRYIVVAEFLKMDEALPEASSIDEIFILRRQRNLERLHEGFVANPIYSDLVKCIYDEAISHLKKVWWDPTSALVEGRVFNFPR